MRPRLRPSAGAPLPLAGGAGVGRVSFRRSPFTGPPLTPPASGRGIACAFAALVGILWATPAAARDTVEASAPSALAVTLYRDPDRGPDATMDRDWPRGFAMITETRQVTLPPGESTVRFAGVAEGMVAVSAIVTGLPGGTIEKNRNADLLSPAALVDGTLGNRVTLTRTNPATGEAVSESAVVRTRADGGLVLQTAAGFEAVRCSGLPEKLTFERVPAGLSAQPVFSVDTRSPSGGTYTVELTYLAWGFDWQAHYVAHLDEAGRGDAVKMRLMSWLTLLNDNGQSFPDAELLVVAGRLNVVSDFDALSDPPDARALRLTCYPLGSTAAGTAIPRFPARSAPPAPMAPQSRRAEDVNYSPSAVIVVSGAMKASEEQLGDLKLYRVPEPVTVAANGLKQVAFLDQDSVEGRLLYTTRCTPDDDSAVAVPAAMLLATVNDREHGLGMALPMGGIALFEPSSAGDLLVGEHRLRDYAEGQDVEIGLGESGQVFARCTVTESTKGKRWRPRLVLTNANPGPARVRVVLGRSGVWRFASLRGMAVKDGNVIVETTVPANGRRQLTWAAE